jgi:hypothetical protein
LFISIDSLAAADGDVLAALAVEPDEESLESLEQAVRASGRSAAAETATAARRRCRGGM